VAPQKAELNWIAEHYVEQSSLRPKSTKCEAARVEQTRVTTSLLASRGVARRRASLTE
jgi:hypothetical protein